MKQKIKLNKKQLGELDRGRKIAWKKMKGRPKTKEDKEKFRLAKLGKPRAGNPKKWKHTQETKTKISEAKKGIPSWNKGIASPWTSKRNRLMKGDKSPVWKGGITPINKAIRNSLEYKEWRKAVFERDNYTCIWCGIKSGSGKTVILNADHIKPFAFFIKLRFVISNGRTLCLKCHKKTKTYFWKAKKYAEVI